MNYYENIKTEILNSIMITKEFGKGYNETNLKYFRQFYKF